MDGQADNLAFVEPSIDDFVRMLSHAGDSIETRGGGPNDIFIYTPYRRGGSFLSFLGRRVLPMLKPHLLNFGSNVMRDLRDGSGLKQAIKNRGIETAKDLGRQIIRGGCKGKKRKKAQPKRKKTKRRKLNKLKIFTDI